jgi:protein-tyrosine phosphatase
VSYVDLHCHILPGVDDGARTMDDAVHHARRLDAEGVRDVACTPHIKRDDFPGVRLDELAGRRREAQAALDADGVRVRLHPGGELAHEEALRLAPRELALIAQGPPGARWLLLECPFAGLDEEFAAAAARVSGLGYGLLLAHPERAADGHERLEPLLDEGALLQVNVSSLLGSHGERARELGERLVKDDLVFCLASDAHPGMREQTLALGLPALLRLGAGRAAALRLTRENPGALLRQGVPDAVRRAA